MANPKTQPHTPRTQGTGSSHSLHLLGGSVHVDNLEQGIKIYTNPKIPILSRLNTHNKNRREFKRFYVADLAMDIVVICGGIEHRARVLNISMSGLRLSSPIPQPFRNKLLEVYVCNPVANSTNERKKLLIDSRSISLCDGYVLKFQDLTETRALFLKHLATHLK